MFRLNLKVALRNLWKNRGYTAINILGLSIGMASCILIFIFISFQFSFDKTYKNKDRIYRFVTNWKYKGYNDHSQGVPVVLGATARNELAGLDQVASIVRDGGIITIKDNAGKIIIKEEKRTFYAESEFFDIFDVNWVAGNPSGLQEPNTVVISESLALIYFGSAEKALGKNILYENETNLKVTGIFSDLPSNSSFPLNIVISYPTYPYRNNKEWDSVSSGMECYFLLKNGLKSGDLQQPLNDFNNRHFNHKGISGKQTVGIQALADIHFSEQYGNYSDSSISEKEIYGLVIIGIFLILTACINFINLATAQAISRSKEVGVRKVMGSRRRQLIIQFLTETFVISLIALLAGCVLAELAIPLIENLIQVKVSFSLFDNYIIFLFMAILVLLVSLLSGFYPAVIMSGFSPALAIKNKMSVNSGSLSLRKVLVIVQFSITVILIISTLFILKQMDYIKKKPLGFNSQAIAIVNAPADSISKMHRAGFMQRVMQISGVQEFSYCSREPLSGDMNTTNFSFDGKKNEDFETRKTPADADYFSLFGLHFIAGKVYQKSDTINGYIVNETFLKKLGITNMQTAIGKIVEQDGKRAPVVGVVQDFNDRSLKNSISPMLFYQGENYYYRTAIKIDNRRIIPVMNAVERIWNDTYPNEVYKASFVEDRINNYYNTEQLMSKLLNVFAAVIIFISVIGLFGLISFIATQRTRELAIRKVLGASTTELVKMLNSTFFKMVLIANILAWPLAYLFVYKWLAGFSYRTTISIWPFLIAMGVSLFITMVTVSIRSYRAVLINAADALKYE